MPVIEPMPTRLADKPTTTSNERRMPGIAWRYSDEMGAGQDGPGRFVAPASGRHHHEHGGAQPPIVSAVEHRPSGLGYVTTPRIASPSVVEGESLPSLPLTSRLAACTVSCEFR
jgi:hypothetical protein